MIEINAWVKDFLRALDKKFGDRVWFAGLQGSYGRNEAGDTSDIDVVVILDKFSPSDIKVYDAMLDTLPHRWLICGFISGKKEILNWESSDLFQFYYDTKPLKGSLDELLPLIDAESINRAIKIGVCNLYHGCVHNMLHEKSEEFLKGLYKTAVFTIQAIVFREKGIYIGRHKDLLEIVPCEDQAVVKIFLELKKGGNVDFQKMSEILFMWSKMWIEKSSSL